jgi:hypothetical protein
MDNIDHIAKTDSGFPTIADRAFLVTDGFGSFVDSRIDVFTVETTIARVFEELPPVTFIPLFSRLNGAENKTVRRFKVPDKCEIRQQGHRHIVSKDGVDLFKVIYDRDHDLLSFDFKLLGDLKGLMQLTRSEWNNKQGGESRYRFTPSDPWVPYAEAHSQFPEVLKQAFRDNFVRCLSEWIA